MTIAQPTKSAHDHEDLTEITHPLIGGTFVNNCESGATSLLDLCKFFLLYWKATPTTEKDEITNALIRAAAKYNTYNDADISAFESAILLCEENTSRSNIVLSETMEKNLADICCKAFQMNDQSRLITLLGRLFRKTARYVNEKIQEKQLPFVMLEGIMHAIPPTSISSIITRPPHVFLSQSSEFQHKDFFWKDKDYDRITHRFKTNRMWVKEKFGAEYAQIIAPDKQSIYDDICPTDVPGYNQQTQSVINAIQRAGVSVVYPRKELKEGRAVRDTYYLTDSHWNDYGAYLAYRATMAELGGALNSRTVTPEEFSFAENREIRDQGGRLLPPFWETTHPIIFKDEGGVTVKEGAGNFTAPGAWKIYENRDKKLPVALVFRDSFFTHLAPFFARSFSKTICLRAKIGAISIELLEKFRPDVVLGAHVERHVGLCAWKNRTSFDLYADDLDAGLLPADEEQEGYDQDIFEAIIAAIRLQFSTSIHITQDTVAHDVNGWDSLSHFTLLLLLEGQIGFKFNDVIKYESSNVRKLASNITKARNDFRASRPTS